MKRLAKNIFLIFLILLLLSGIFSLFSKPQENEISLSQLVSDINQDRVREISILGNELEIIYKDEGRVKSRKEIETSLSQSLINYGVDREKLKEVNIQTKERAEIWDWLGPLLLFGILPFLSLVIFFWLMFRQARTGVTQAFDFTRARARLFGAGTHPKEKISFKDVGGLKEAKEELKEVVDFLKNPRKYLQMGAKIPRGVLLIGAPGTGKTLLARAIAFEARVPFLSISGSEFIELFVGVGASRVRDLFNTAKKAGRAIIFIDEIDAIGRVRGPGMTGAHEEREQTLNQILAEMDGFEREDGRIVVAATNRPDMLDPALLRPGRFDRRIVLDLPDIKEREEILKIHCRGKPMALSVNLREVAERTPGFSGADLANVVNEAAILAARVNKSQISQEEFLESIDKVLLGPERRSHILSKKEKEIAAYHEAGHALVSASLPEAEPVRKISIVARGLAAGYTLKMPTEERRIKTKSEFLAEIMALLGGYCAEKVKFGQMSTGAANDLKEASRFTRKLIKEYGMSSLGPISFGEREEFIFLRSELGEYKNYSEKIAEKIDEEVSKIMRGAEKKVTKILWKKRKLLEKIAKRLIEKETIEKEEFENLVKKKKERVKKVKVKKKR
ncbi:cell division protein FtsH [Parcubacteria bacterium DG_74_2]|nr:MAG: cell division protein FtsH [Parcubacteria bacterium DG_74_2]